MASSTMETAKELGGEMGGAFERNKCSERN